MLAWLDEDAGSASDGISRVRYALRQAGGDLVMDGQVGREFVLRFTGARSCTACGRSVKKLFGQGLCFPCFQNAPEASPCIIRPELCRAHLGEGRDPDWEAAHHLQEHIVYLSFTGGVKVGVTRATQVPVRWIDQGATVALPIARVPYRQLAGAMEVDLKKHFADRTDWRKMLLWSTAGGREEELLLQARGRVEQILDPALRQYLVPDGVPVRLAYPLADVPPKLVSVQLDKLPGIAGRLKGIKGQYLVWADGRVLNVRNHTGFHVEISGS